MKDEGQRTKDHQAPPEGAIAAPNDPSPRHPVLRPSSPRVAQGRLFVLTHRVRYRECDSMGVVYHTHYLDWFEAARTEALRELGLAYRDLEATGILLQVVDASVHFRGAARYDDRVEVETVLHAPDGVRVETDYVVRVEGAPRPIVTGRVTLAFVDAARRRPVAPPAHVAALFESAVAGA